MGASHSLTNTTINWFNSSSVAYKYIIEVSTNDSTYTTVVDKSGNTSFGDTSDNYVATGRYQRITVSGKSCANCPTSIFECKVFGN